MESVDIEWRKENQTICKRGKPETMVITKNNAQ